MSNNINENYTFQEFLKEIVNNDLEIFRNLTMWSDKTKKEFSELLEDLDKKPEAVTETTRSIGDKLENIVKFIIDKSFFLRFIKTSIPHQMKLMRLLSYLMKVSKHFISLIFQEPYSKSIQI